MARNGSGTYAAPINAWNPALNGVSATAADWQALLNDLVSAMTQSISADGQTPITGNLAMGGNKLTGLGAGVAAGQSLRFEQLFDQGIEADLASGTTTDIGAQNTNFLQVTGSTTITSFGTTYRGPRFVRFSGALTLTHNATTLILPGAASILTVAGDVAIVVPVATAGTPTGWKVVGYQRASGMPATAGPLASSGITGAAASGANTDITSLNNGLVANLPGVAGMFKNLQASATGLSANVSVTADEVVAESASNQFVTLRTVNLTIAGTSVGANALDAGSIAASTWYSLWVIWNGTTTAGLLSLSATAPTLPSGYTHKARIGWIRTDASGNKYPLSFTQFGKRVRYKVAGNVTGYPAMASGIQGSVTIPTWVAVAVGNFIPTTASSIHGTMFNNSGANGRVMVAPNNAHGVINSDTNPPYATVNASTDLGQKNFEMLLESTSIYIAGNGGTFWLCQGWEDNL